MASKKKEVEKPFATVTIRLFDNSRKVDIVGFERVSERILDDLIRFIREELYVLRSAAVREQRALEREREAALPASQEDVPTEEGENLPLPSSVEEVEALIVTT